MAPGKVGTETAIHFQRTYAAPRERVYQAWLEPEALKQWFGPHEDFTIPTVEVDARVGGKYRFVLVSPEGNRNTAAALTAANDTRNRAFPRAVCRCRSATIPPTRRRSLCY